MAIELVLHLVNHELRVHERDTHCLDFNFQVGDDRAEQILLGGGAMDPIVHAVVLHPVEHELPAQEGISHCLDLNLRVGDGRAESKRPMWQETYCAHCCTSPGKA